MEPRLTQKSLDRLRDTNGLRQFLLVTQHGQAVVTNAAINGPEAAKVHYSIFRLRPLDSHLLRNDKETF